MNTETPSLLSVNNYHYPRGGAEAVYLRHNAIFERMGWNVAPFSMQHSKNVTSPWSRYFVSEIEFGEQYSLWEKIQRVPRVIYSFEARRNVRMLLDSFPADICHVHNLYHHLSPSILGAIRSRNIPVIMTLHDLKLACPAYQMLSRDGVCERCNHGRIHNVLLNRCIKGSAVLSSVVLAETLLHRLMRSYERFVDRFIVPSRFYLEKLVEWGWDRDRFVHIPNAIDVDEYVPAYTPGQSFIYFGRLSREKGLSTLITAADLAGVSLTIVGTGPYEQQLRRQAEASNSHVEFTGYLSGTALHNAIAGSRAVVLPSEWFENAPLAVLEAYGLGKPVIGAAIGGLPELIQDNVTGATFESGSPEGLASVLSRFSILSDSSISTMGRAGHSLIARDFCTDKYRSEMINLYSEHGVSCDSMAIDRGIP